MIILMVIQLSDLEWVGSSVSVYVATAIVMTPVK